MANTYYIVSKTLNKKIADEFLKDSLKLFSFIDMTEDVIKNSVNNRYKDFEDDLHYFTSLDNSIDFLITRNKKDFKTEKIKIVDAEEFISIVNFMK